MHRAFGQRGAQPVDARRARCGMPQLFFTESYGTDPN